MEDNPGDAPLNPFVIVLLVITFVGSESIGFELADDWPARILAVLLITAMVPAVALFQTGLLIRKFRVDDEPLLQRKARCQRMMVAHSLVWLAASGAIIWALRWQDVVLGNWKLDRWPLVAELTILAPSILAMGLSWLAWFELNRALQIDSIQPAKNPEGFAFGSNQANTNQFSASLKSLWNECVVRWTFVSHRFRLFFLSLIVPAMIVWFGRRGGQFLDYQQVEVSPPVAIAVLVLFAIAFPFLMTMVWKNRTIQDSSLAKQFDQINRTNQLRVFGFREWQTNGQIANAGVVGFFPFARFVFLSDVIIERFPSREVGAVLRHEAGHIVRHHAILRTLMLSIPMLVWLIYFGYFARPSNFAGASPLICSLITGLFLLLGGLCNRWIAHQTEWDADLFAVSGTEKSAEECLSSHEKESDENSSTGPESGNRNNVCLEKSREMIDALYRLAAYSGIDFQKGTWFHPSTRSRIDFIEKVGNNPELIRSFRNQFWIKLTSILVAWGTLGAIGCWLNAG